MNQATQHNAPEKRVRRMEIVNPSVTAPMIHATSQITTPITHGCSQDEVTYYEIRSTLSGHASSDVAKNISPVQTIIYISGESIKFEPSQLGKHLAHGVTVYSTWSATPSSRQVICFDTNALIMRGAAALPIATEALSASAWGPVPAENLPALDQSAQQSILSKLPLPSHALKFLPSNVVSFAEALPGLVESTAASLRVPIQDMRWSVFTDPEESTQELVLIIATGLQPDKALEFWDVVGDMVEGKQRSLSATLREMIVQYISIEIRWP